MTAEGQDLPMGRELPDMEHSLPVANVLERSILALNLNGKPLRGISRWSGAASDAGVVRHDAVEVAQPVAVRGVGVDLLLRMNPRDASIVGVVPLHRVMRRSSSYGPMLPEGVMEDDGEDRGIIFVACMARLDRQFEFLKTEWINQGLFFGSPDEKDPLIGPNDGTGQFTIPQRPIRRRLTDLPSFVVNRGGEYCCIPSLSALRWLSELNT